MEGLEMKIWGRGKKPENDKPIIKDHNAGKIIVEVNADTDELIAKCRTISKHLTALADELEGMEDEKVVREGTD
jgi:hypothetical protein